MRTKSYYITCFTALLLLSFATGCCNPNKNPSAGPSAQQTPPTVTSVTPNGNAAVCSRHHHCQRNLQQGDESCDDQYIYVYSDRTKWRDRSGESFLRIGD